MRNRFIGIFRIIMLASLILAGCGNLDIGIQTTPINVQEESTPTPTYLAPTPTTELQSATLPPEAASSSPWVEVRDDEGFGFAVPCWWTVIAPPPGGIFRTITIRSYDDAFAQANTVKGAWIGGNFPPGAVKIDLTVMGEIDPGVDDLTSARQALTNDEAQVVSTEPLTVGTHEAILVGVADRDNLSDTSTSYVFRLAPDKLLVVSALPQGALVTSDMKAILESLALNGAEQVANPTVAPSPPLIEVPAACPPTL